jgi:hypothetical protein
MPFVKTGTAFTGTVTQSGVMVDGDFRYDALQTCTLTVTETENNNVSCDIQRKELKKFVNGSQECNPSYPEYLRNYLTSHGSCIEHATGVYNPFTRMLTIRGEWPKTLSPSAVVWSPHLYMLVISDHQMMGPVFCIDGMEDHKSETGAMNLKMVQ